MLLGKYHIVIFRDGGFSRNLRMRAWFGLLLFMIFIGLIICNIWLWQHYLENTHLSTKLAENERERVEQNTQLLSMLGKIDEVSLGLRRMERFDSKLRIMLDLDNKVEDAESLGSRGDDLGSNYLPLHRQELMARKMNSFLNQLAEDVTLEEVQQQDLLVKMRENHRTLISTPSIWPLTGLVSSYFGVRDAPFGGGKRFHRGLDITGRVGTPIIATADGIVMKTGHSGAYGICVELSHGNNFVTKYAHLQKSNVKNGQWVNRGDVIGFVGMTGRTTGPHLHYEVLIGGVPVNPLKYILN